MSAALTTHNTERNMRYNAKKCFLSKISDPSGFLCVFIKRTHYYFVRFVPESVRWLRSKNKLVKAENILRKIASSNNKEYPSNVQLQPVKSSEVHSGSFKDLVSNFQIASITLRLCLMWLVYLTSFQLVFP